jgi:hypothetical protein
MKRILKIVWPCLMVGLAIFLVIAVRFYSARHAIVADQLAQMGRCIHADDATQWKDVSIEGEDPMMFHKDLTVNHGVESIAGGVVIVSSSVITALALATAIWQYRGKSPNQKVDLIN